MVSKHSKTGECWYCTTINKAKRTLGLRHSMLPVKVWHGITHWKWKSGYAVMNSKWKLRRIEEKLDE